MSPLNVLPSSPRPAQKRRILARGTETAKVTDRRIRVLPRGSGAPDPPKRGLDGVHIEKHGDAYVVSKPSVGALSALNARDFVAFHLFLAAPDDDEALARYYRQIGLPDGEASRRAAHLRERLEREGWRRTELPTPEMTPLASVYLTVTRYCDLGCPYCYQGLADRVNTEMSVEKADLVLERIKRVNPNCHVVVSGGEPFSHSRIFDILELLDQKELSFVILSNGTFVDDECASRLQRLRYFRQIQLSLDGMTPEVHDATRGKGHFEKAMAGIRSVMEHGIPFILAPTMHEGNLHELPAIAELAIANGGWISPNQLKEFPHAGLDYRRVSLSNASLSEGLRRLNDHLVEKFGLDVIAERSQRYKGAEVCSVTAPNSTFICGMAHSLMDVNWNGDVYPCHLTKDDQLILGNVFEEDFDRIFQRVEEKGIRVHSHEIEQCSSCKFISTCGGGCRAGAWFTYGTLQHHDEHCDANYASNLKKLLVGAGVQ